MERRLAVHAGAQRRALIALAALVAGVAPAAAAPKGRAARKQFERGVKAYTRGDYAAAAAALAKSAALEADAETLYALAQADRKLDHCDRAIPLYQKLLAMDLPAANREAVTQQLAECQQTTGAAPSPPDDTAAGSEPAPAPDAPPPPPAHDDAPPPPAPDDTAPPPAHDDETPAREHHAVTAQVDARDGDRAESPHPREGRSWWQDPVGDTLLCSGLVGVGLGTVFLVTARSADQDRAHATSYPDYVEAANKARTDGEIGVAAASAGGGLVVVSLIWYATHRDRPAAPVTGWVAPNGGGVVLSGRF